MVEIKNSQTQEQNNDLKKKNPGANLPQSLSLQLYIFEVVVVFNDWHVGLWLVTLHTEESPQGS